MRERAAILLVQTPSLSPLLPLACFSMFPFRPSNLGLFGASLQTNEADFANIEYSSNFVKGFHNCFHKSRDSDESNIANAFFTVIIT